MLRLYRRHRTSCSHKSERYRRCACPLYVEGSLRGEYVRKALDLTSWEAGANLIRDWEASGHIGVIKADIPTISEAIDKYLKDCEARNLTAESVKKLRYFLVSKFLAHCESKGFRRLAQVDVQSLREFRESWKYSPVSAQNRLGYIRSFFRFCNLSGWMSQNPALAVKLPKVNYSPTLPLEEAEIAKMLTVADEFWPKGDHGPGIRKRIRAMILLLRYSGLRISDACTLERSRVKDGKLFLRTQKTGTMVWLPLPPNVIQALEEAPNSNADYFFWNGTHTRLSAVKIWNRTFKRVFEKADITGGHIHRLRDSFAVGLLERGVDIETVSVLLGHSNSRVTSRHYNPWIRTRQIALEEAVRRTWIQAVA